MCACFYFCFLPLFIAFVIIIYSLWTFSVWNKPDWLIDYMNVYNTQWTLLAADLSWKQHYKHCPWYNCYYSLALEQMFKIYCSHLVNCELIAEISTRPQLSVHFLTFLFISIQMNNQLITVSLCNGFSTDIHCFVILFSCLLDTDMTYIFICQLQALFDKNDPRAILCLLQLSLYTCRQTILSKISQNLAEINTKFHCEMYLMVAGKSGQYNTVKTTEQNWTVVNAPTTKPRRTDRLVVSTELKTSIHRLDPAIYQQFHTHHFVQLCRVSSIQYYIGHTIKNYLLLPRSILKCLYTVGWQEKHSVVKTHSNTNRFYLTDLVQPGINTMADWIQHRAKTGVWEEMSVFHTLSWQRILAIWRWHFMWKTSSLFLSTASTVQVSQAYVKIGRTGVW